MSWRRRSKTLAQPIVVTVSHSLGAAEAQRRIARGLEKGQTELSSVFSAFEADWKANHADLRLVALHQQVTAALDVFDDVVRVEVSLPWYLSALQDKIAGVLKRQSEKALQIGQG